MFGNSQYIYDNSSINKSHEEEYDRWESLLDGAHSYDPVIPSAKRKRYERKILGPLHNENHFYNPAMKASLQDDDMDREYLPLITKKRSKIRRLEASDVMSIKPVDIDIRRGVIQTTAPPNGKLEGVKALLSDIISYTKVLFLMSSQHTRGLLLSLWALLNILLEYIRYFCVQYLTLPHEYAVTQYPFSPSVSVRSLSSGPSIDSPDTSSPPTPETTPKTILSPPTSQSDSEDEIAVEISLFDYDSNYNPHSSCYAFQSFNNSVAVGSRFLTHRPDADHSYLLPVTPPNDPSNPNPVDAQGNLPLSTYDPDKDGRCLTRPKHSKWTRLPANSKLRGWPPSVAQAHTPAPTSTATSTLTLTSASTSIDIPLGSSVQQPQLVTRLLKQRRVKETKQARPPAIDFPFIDDLGHLSTILNPDEKFSHFPRGASPWLHMAHDISDDELIMGGSGSQLGLTFDAEFDAEY